jgi:predicted ester cyclase
MSQEIKQVRRFYDEIWNLHEKDAIPEVIACEFTFRGSLGLMKKGREGFVEYLDMVHEALANYQCSIKEIVSEGSKVFAKMEFFGIHQGEFLGHPATGKQVTWEGAALFHFSGSLISSLWVLGDIKGLESQLIHEKT